MPMVIKICQIYEPILGLKIFESMNTVVIVLFWDQTPFVMLLSKVNLK